MNAPTKMHQPGPIKSAFLKWLGMPVTLSDAGFWSAWYGNESSTGECVTPETALKLSAVWACVRLLAETASTLPLKLYKIGDDGTHEVAKDHPVHKILAVSPNADMTPVSYWEANFAALLLRGTTWGEIHRAGDRIIAIDFLIPDRVGRRRLPSGAIETTYIGDDGKVRVIPPKNVFWIPAFSLDGMNGLSPISVGANVFGAAISADKAASKMFKNGLISSFFFKIDRVLNGSQRAEFRDSMDRISGAMNAGKPPLLEAGMDAKALGLNPTDAQLLESRAFSVEEICRWYRVPPFMVGHSSQGQTNWGTGIEQQMIGFLVFTLNTWLVRVEQAINKHLLTPAERLQYTAKFTREALLQADSAARSAFFSIMVQNGIMTRDEARVKENLPRRGGNADVLTVQTNLSPIDLLGKTPDATSARDALKQWLGIDAAEKSDET